MALEDQHDAVALLDAQRFEIIRGLVGAALHIFEGEAALDLVLVDMEHSELVGGIVRDGVDTVESEVELILVAEGYGLEVAVLVLDSAYELLGDEGLRGDMGAHKLVVDLFGHLLAGQDDGDELAVGAVHGDHAVRRGRIVVDAVAGAEDFGIVADLDLHLAGQNEVELLAVVLCEMDGLVLQTLVIVILTEIRLGDLVLEHGSDVDYGDALFLCGLAAAAAAGNGIRTELGGFALEDIGDPEAEGQSALMYECKRKIGAAFLIGAVFVRSDLGLFGHFLHGIAGDLAHFAYTGGNLHELIVLYY